MITEKDKNRFLSKILKTDSCWIYKEYKDKNNYGKFWFKNKSIGAHRFSYMIFKSEIINGLICHTCDNPFCINPDHLYDGTYKDNVKDMMDRGRCTQRNKKYCQKGHEYTKENTYVNPNTGHRLCKICHRIHENNKRKLILSGERKKIKNKNLKQCKHGHAYPENAGYSKTGVVYCKKCHCLREKERRREKNVKTVEVH